MLENQKLGWKKLKTKNKDIQTKKEVELEEIRKTQIAADRQPNYGDNEGSFGGGGRGGRAARTDRGDNRRDERRDGEKVYMKK
jgi:hypothetical protein